MCHAIRYLAQEQSGPQGSYRRAVQLLALTVVASFGYGLAVSPYFAIREVQICAPDGAIAKLALAKTKVPGGASTLLYPVERLAKQLEEYPEIKQASIERALPNRLVVHIVRRHPVAAIGTNEEWALVDEQGICVSTSTELPASLICFYGLVEKPLEPGQQLNGTALQLLRETLEGLKDYSDSAGLVMDFTDRHLIQIHMPTGVLGKLGSPDNLKRKIMMFLAIMEQLEGKGHQPAYIDVRIMDQPVWKPQPKS